MKNVKLNIAMGTLALVLVSGCGSPLQSERDHLGDPASISDAKASLKISERTAMTLSISPLKPAVELGEPAYVAIEIRNTSQSRFSIAGNLSTQDENVAIFIEGPSKKRMRFSPYSLNDTERVINLTPGQAAGNIIPVFFGAEGWTFREAGDYRIYAELVASGDGFSRFRSEPARLTVERSAAGDALFKAGDDTLHEAGKFLLWRSGDHLESGQRHIAAIAEEYSDTALASHIQASFMRSASEPFSDYTKNEVRPADCRRVLSLRSSINRADLPKNIVIEQDIALARCLAEAGRMGQAAERLDRALALAGDDIAYFNYAQTLDGFKQNLRQSPKREPQ